MLARLFESGRRCELTLRPLVLIGHPRKRARIVDGFEPAVRIFFLCRGRRRRGRASGEEKSEKECQLFHERES